MADLDVDPSNPNASQTSLQHEQSQRESEPEPDNSTVAETPARRTATGGPTTTTTIAAQRNNADRSIIVKALARLGHNVSMILALLTVFGPFTVLPYAFIKTTWLTFAQKLSFLFSHQLAIRTIPYFRNPTLFGYPVDSWWNFLKHSPHWKACLAYLQLSVESESEKAWGDDEENVGDRNILCGMFPHGVLSISHAISHLSGELARVGNADRQGNESKRVKFVTQLATLQSNFMFPGFRELLLSNGVVPVTPTAILASLSPDPQPQQTNEIPTRRCLVLVPGGAAESAFVPHERPTQSSTFSLSDDPSSSSSQQQQTFSSTTNAPIQLLLARRLGFIRLALQAGSALVACFSFGELELYRQPKSKWYHRFADWVKQKTGVRPTLGFGWGGLPFIFPDTSHPVVLVMSRPIPLPKIANPTEKEVRYWHAVFCRELRGVYERHRGRFWGYDGRDLDLVGWEEESVGVEGVEGVVELGGEVALKAEEPKTERREEDEEEKVE